jgi:hypothetical protein
MTTLDTLNKILTNIQNNRDAVAQQIVASTKAYGSPPAIVEEAINLLIAHYGSNVQLIGHAIGAKLQIEQLEGTATEINALIAAMQVVLSHDEIVDETNKILAGEANESPLSVAGGDSESAPATDAAPSEAPAVPAETSDAGTPVAASAPVDGTAPS